MSIYYPSIFHLHFLCWTGIPALWSPAAGALSSARQTWHYRSLCCLSETGTRDVDITPNRSNGAPRCYSLCQILVTLNTPMLFYLVKPEGGLTQTSGGKAADAMAWGAAAPMVAQPLPSQDREEEDKNWNCSFMDLDYFFVSWLKKKFRISDEIWTLPTYTAWAAQGCPCLLYVKKLSKIGE